MAGAALRDIRVLDFSQQLPAPFTTFLLAQLGAEVIKVEPPSGDAGREIDPRMFQIVNAGKRSVVVDLKDEGDRDRLRGLAATCSVVVEGFRPGTAERLGFGYEQMRELRPDVVYCSLSGYGAGGPYRDLAGHDVNYLGVAAGARADQAGWIGVPFIDLGSGTTAALAILAAVRERDTTGEGCRLDLGMLDVATFWSGVKVPPAEGSEPVYGVFVAADGGMVSLAVLEDKFWRNLCNCLGWDDWVGDPDLATHARRRLRGREIEARLREAIEGMPRDAWLERFAAADVPAAPAYLPPEVGLDPQVQARHLVERGEGSDPDWRPVSPLPAGIRRDGRAAAPALGADGADLLA
jgi:crotonobetainyl-CoA:carnitine CoA-transferase CaiB-like acyl-CoA transferase